MYANLIHTVFEAINELFENGGSLLKHLNHRHVICLSHCYLQILISIIFTNFK